MAKTLFTFPGQGTQYAGMLESIPNRDVWLKRAETALGHSLYGVDSELALENTQNVQICLLISGCANAEDVMTKGIVPQMTSISFVKYVD